MNPELVEKIATSVLYEGYILYPYRPSAIKNRQRWNFGTLYPLTYSEGQSGTDAWSSQTECLVVAGEGCTIDLKARFLHFQQREARELITPQAALQQGVEPQYRVVEALEVEGQRFQTWQEALERKVSTPSLDLQELTAAPRSIRFNFPQTREVQVVSGSAGPEGVVARTQQAVEGALEVSATQLDGGLFRMRVRVMNLTALDERFAKDQEEASLRSLVSAHTILHVRQGEFVSLLEPAEEHREAAAACRNVGVFPVLVGAEGERDTMLSSPIILYDYPQVAPESAGDFFDGTEMDEMLTLRVMTLTDEEKQEMRHGDERARQILDRTELLPQDQLLKVHGAMRNLRPRASNVDRASPEKD